MKYVEPKFNEKAFTCPYCGTYAQQNWTIRELDIIWKGTYTMKEKSNNYISKDNFDELNKLSVSTCQVCKKYHIWHNDKMIVPTNSPIPMPIEDMPEVVKELYLEARDVYPISYKSSCALLRLAVQHLCKELGEKGKNINEDIGSLVSKGLPEKIQKALDIVRVIGNNAVHPGKMDEQDTKEYARRMFSLLNFIVEDRIVRPKEIDDLFDGLPEDTKKAITNRDS
ncbi:DUF4145 domain-containing protein [Clostridium perfringens]|uniref:DUF4145 domain-containing protein n=1 Tax=Clostridium perfringens TaxID=1502 RepID=UPI0024BC1171|nr:DUF4145 domain-containing protein [Clostridium perfringens]ELC8430433.1 DUF4145 domain-containing protein [Clostridium perfringens]ELC8452781.1 DUF4145 domain-containing protein [Clostridium perfringens]MDU6427062.1 DUF4145 domain-containing protein [Clostridium perfringens]